ncbi:hypothetical protein [Rhizobium leguminosarum]|uniref:hypothetical protein n=1 Tax=Rhizobium leguminosarum TaxID=384 RepID=UPI0013E90EB9|nr:hypothetical protein [Rhizobium leguminosarum]
MKQSYGGEAVSGKGKHASLSTFRILPNGFRWPCGRRGRAGLLETSSTAFPQLREKLPSWKDLESFSDSASPRNLDEMDKSFRCCFAGAQQMASAVDGF